MTRSCAIAPLDARCLALVVLAVLLTADAWAEPAEDAQPKGPPVAATVNGEPVYSAEVNTLLAKTAQRTRRPVDASPKNQAEALDQVVKRRLVTQVLKREGGYYTDAEVEDLIRAEAKAQNMTIEELAAGQGTSLDAMRNELIWHLAWGRYVERNIADELQTYFNAHHKEFDGTQVRASHILLRPQRVDESNEQLIQLGEKIRAAIEAGKVTFEQAAERFSVGPSRAQGGDLGFFPRRGVMSEPFSKTAFELEKDQISEPVVSPYGVHLIRVTDTKPGTKQWTEVVNELRLPASLEMFNNLVEKERATAKIEFTGIVPYFKPDTDEVVVSGGTSN